MNLALKTFKKGEFALIEIKHDSSQDDEPLKNLLISTTSKVTYNPLKNLFMEINLIRIVKVKDLKKDGKVLLKNFRIGKGLYVQKDSIVKCRLRVIVDDTTYYNNYPDSDPNMSGSAFSHTNTPYDLFKSEDLFPLSIE